MPTAHSKPVSTGMAPWGYPLYTSRLRTLTFTHPTNTYVSMPDSTYDDSPLLLPYLPRGSKVSNFSYGGHRMKTCVRYYYGAQRPARTSDPTSPHLTTDEPALANVVILVIVATPITTPHATPPGSALSLRALAGAPNLKHVYVHGCSLDAANMLRHIGDTFHAHPVKLTLQILASTSDPSSSLPQNRTCILSAAAAAFPRVTDLYLQGNGLYHIYNKPSDVVVAWIHSADTARLDCGTLTIATSLPFTNVGVSFTYFTARLEVIQTMTHLKAVTCHSIPTGPSFGQSIANAIFNYASTLPSVKRVHLPFGYHPCRSTSRLFDMRSWEQIADILRTPGRYPALSKLIGVPKVDNDSFRPFSRSIATVLAQRRNFVLATTRTNWAGGLHTPWGDRLTRDIYTGTLRTRWDTGTVLHAALLAHDPPRALPIDNRLEDCVTAFWLVKLGGRRVERRVCAAIARRQARHTRPDADANPRPAKRARTPAATAAPQAPRAPPGAVPAYLVPPLLRRVLSYL